MELGTICISLSIKRFDRETSGRCARSDGAGEATTMTAAVHFIVNSDRRVPPPKMGSAQLTWRIVTAWDIQRYTVITVRYLMTLLDEGISQILDILRRTVRIDLPNTSVPSFYFSVALRKITVRYSDTPLLVLLLRVNVLCKQSGRVDPSTISQRHRRCRCHRRQDHCSDGS